MVMGREVGGTVPLLPRHLHLHKQTCLATLRILEIGPHAYSDTRIALHEGRRDTGKFPPPFSEVTTAGEASGCHPALGSSRL